VNRAALLLIVCLAVTCPRAFPQSNSPEPTTPQAQVRLGNEYLDQKDYSSAMIWFRKAAEKGNAVAQNNIGWLYQNGWGVSRDYAQAINWYRRAANQGYDLAEVNIGWLYEQGLGADRDYAEAMVWYRKAADQGSTHAR
jgi:TPR repeat protein